MFWGKFYSILFFILLISFSSDAYKIKRCKDFFINNNKPLNYKYNFNKKDILNNLSVILDVKDKAILEASYEAFIKHLHSGKLALKAGSNSKPRYDWYKDATEYMFYVDLFGSKKANADFYTTKRLVPYLKDLGVDILYPLPFLESPGLDGGFDVKDYFKVDERYGGIKAFREFAKEAKKNNMFLKMDLVLNHISDEHKWFKAFLNGNMKYKDYFITRETPPEIVDILEDVGGKIITYRETDESGGELLVKRRLIFPGGSSSHYREVLVPKADGTEKKFWVYHTFYPFQIDLNFKNPDVLKEVYKIINFWVSEGIDVFRLDAIPFLDKTTESHKRVFEIIKHLNSYMLELSQGSILMVEAAQEPEQIIKYLGKEKIVKSQKSNQNADIKRTDHAQMAYGFTQMMYTWGAMLTEDPSLFIKGYKSSKKIPSSSAMANFLRVHDELTLEMLSNTLLKESIYDSLIQNDYGVAFRNGAGVSGRLSNFLNNDERRINLAFSLLFSQPGVPVIYYGDEIAAQNNLLYAISRAKEREEILRNKGIKVLDSFDSRDVGRGEIDIDHFNKVIDKAVFSRSSEVFKKLKNMIYLRKKYPQLRRGELKFIISDSPKVLMYELVLGKYQKIIIVNNLSKDFTSIEFDLNELESARNLLESKDADFSGSRLLLKSFETIWFIGK